MFFMFSTEHVILQIFAVYEKQNNINVHSYTHICWSAGISGFFKEQKEGLTYSRNTVGS